LKTWICAVIRLFIYLFLPDLPVLHMAIVTN
jgi:hypothetical protein